jgi:polyisoprenoid-binding protein YceI
MLNKMIFLAVFVMGLSSMCPAATLIADPKNSSVFFNISHGLGYTIGYFEKFTASVETDGDTIISAKAVIDVDSINTHSAWRDEGLRSSLFFDVAKFPQAVFQSSKVEGNQMTGMLTIKGISKPITLTVGLNEGVFTAQGSFNRSDFGISYNKELKHHEKAIGDKVDLMVALKVN